MRYEVGDKVKIRHDLAERGESGAFDDGSGYDDEMRRYAGMIMTIARVFPHTYHMIEDHERWWWDDDMLDPNFTTESEGEKMYNVGDKIVIKSNLSEVESALGIHSDMLNYAGTPATIKCIGECANGRYYIIDIDNGEWMWGDEMFETEKEEKTMEVNHEAVERIDYEDVTKNIFDTLDICEIYHPTERGVESVLKQWKKAKGQTPIWNGMSVLDILSKHPDYVPGKGYIVKRNEYDRGVDFDVISSALYNIKYAVEDWASNNFVKPIEIKPWSFDEVAGYRDKLKRILDGMDFADRYLTTYRGMTYGEVLKEYSDWNNRKALLEDSYYIINGKCYLFEDKERFEKLHILVRDLIAWCVKMAATYKEKSKEDENIYLQPLLVDENIVKKIEDSNLNIRGIRVGQKFNKVVTKILTEMGMKDTWENYNKETARLGDSASPNKFTRFTIISANPVDYYRMSFGWKWSSCHTIDKEGYYEPSSGGDSYEGMHASGTASYMGDQSTVIMYTVDKNYEGSNYEMEPKINRCMFHLGDGKFIMGRVYPQGTDGEEEVYRQWRQIFQQIIAECMGLPNYWKTLKDRGEKLNQCSTSGTHYPDYEYNYCDVAGWSYIKPTADTKPSKIKINIGSTPICPSCGCEHWEDDTIECSSCREDSIRCCECGSHYDRDDMHYIDGEWYCEDCCFYCEYHGEWETGSSYYVNNYGDVCEYAAFESGEFCRCDSCEDLFCVDSDIIETEDGHCYCSERCAHEDGYIETDNGYWYPEDEVYECPECGAIVTDSEWNDELEMCNSCAENHEDEEEQTA